MTGVLKTIVGAVASLTVAFYFLVIGTDAGRTGIWNFWPQWWLIFVPIVLALSAIAFVGLQLGWWSEERAHRRVARRNAVKKSAALTELFRLQMLEAKPRDLPMRSEMPGYALEDVTAILRASDLRYVVSYGGSAIPIGVITPHKGRFQASHLRAGELGEFDTIEAAKEEIWRVD